MSSNSSITESNIFVVLRNGQDLSNMVFNQEIEIILIPTGSLVNTFIMPRTQPTLKHLYIHNTKATGNVNVMFASGGPTLTITPQQQLEIYYYGTAGIPGFSYFYDSAVLPPITQIKLGFYRIVWNSNAAPNGLFLYTPQPGNNMIINNGNVSSSVQTTRINIPAVSNGLVIGQRYRLMIYVKDYIIPGNLDDRLPILLRTGDSGNVSYNVNGNISCPVFTAPLNFTGTNTCNRDALLLDFTITGTGDVFFTLTNRQSLNPTSGTRRFNEPNNGIVICTPLVT